MAAVAIEASGLQKWFGEGDARTLAIELNFDHTKYDAIGESDRMTLKFRKPD